jgi:hypothetical protein
MIKEFLLWALSKFEDKAPKIEAWPFPVPSEKKPVAKKCVAAKKPAAKKVAAKKTVKKVK